jgi:hypothetical protein
LVVSFEEWSCHLVGCHDHTPLQSMCLMTLNAVLAHHRGDDFFRDVPRLRDVLVRPLFWVVPPVVSRRLSSLQATVDMAPRSGRGLIDRDAGQCPAWRDDTNTHLSE